MRLLLALVLSLLLGACATPGLVPAPAGKAASPRLTEGVFTSGDGYKHPLHRFQPPGTPRAVIAALHGFNDYGHAFHLPGPFLAEHGVALYAYDQRGFGATQARGRWHGEGILAEDLRTFLELLGQRHPGVPLYALGESMGGAVVLAAQARHPLPVQGLILVAPAVWGRETMPWYQRLLLWLAAHTAPRLTLTGRLLDIQASDNIGMLHQLGQDPLVIKETRVEAVWGLSNLMDQALMAAPHLTVPTLILYGDRDQVIPPEPVLHFIRHLPPRSPARLIRYPQGFHMLLRDLAAEKTLQDLLQWLPQTGPAAASGAPAVTPGS